MHCEGCIQYVKSGLWDVTYLQHLLSLGEAIPACLSNTDADFDPRKSGVALVEPLDFSRLAVTVNFKTAMRTPLVKPCQKSQMLYSQD